MTSLIVLISSGKGTWTGGISLINSQNWEKVYVICNSFSYDKFNLKLPNIIKLKFDERNLTKTISNLAKFFKSEIKDFEVALNITSGTGLEHMAILTSILRSGLGVRFVYSSKGKCEEFKILERVQEESF